jgi:hypothetical protein
VAHAWFETNLVSQSLSTIGVTHDQAWGESTEDYVNAVTAHHTAMNTDRRAIATGADIELHWWTMLETSIPGWEANIYANAMRTVLFTECIKATNLLWGSGLPETWMLEQMNDRSKNVTLINNEWLYAFEQFYLNQNAAVPYTDTQYSTMDVQDILAGTNAGTFDYIRLRMKDLVCTTTKFIDAYLSMLAVGGIMYVANSGSYGQIYGNHQALHKHWTTRTNRHLLTKDNLLVFHLVTDDGATIIKRVS